MKHFVRCTGSLLALVAACSDASTGSPADAEPERIDADAGRDASSATTLDGAADASTSDVSNDAGEVGACGAFPPAADLSAPGPFGAASTSEGPSCTIVRPAKLGLGGVRHPVIAWGNGTGAIVSLYAPAFESWASHGFIVAAANATNGQGAGAALLDCLAHVLAQSTTSGSVYEGKVCSRAGASGHSQGGGGALMAGRDPRVQATAPLQPYIAQGYGGFDRASLTAQNGPMLLLSGSADDNATPSIHQQPVFDTTNVPVVWASLIGGDHYSVALGVKTYREVMLAWFRVHLMNDTQLAPLFYGASCTLCADTKWMVKRRGIQ